MTSLQLNAAICVLSALVLAWLLACLRRRNQRLSQQPSPIYTYENSGFPAAERLLAKITSITSDPSKYVSVALERQLPEYLDTFSNLALLCASTYDEAGLQRVRDGVDEAIARIDEELSRTLSPADIDEEIESRRTLLTEAESASAARLDTLAREYGQRRVEILQGLDREEHRVAGLIKYLAATKGNSEED